MDRLTIIGHFGGPKNILDGQTIKTKTLYSELRKNTNWKIYIVDTYYRRKNPIRLICQTLVGLFSSKNIVVLLSINGMRLYFPVLYFAAKYLHKNIFHDVIGGNLAKYVRIYKGFKKYLSSFKCNWVETESLNDDLRSLGLMNCEVLPNFKSVTPLATDELISEYTEPFRFCTFSRVMKEKGIEDAVNAINSINEKCGRTVCLLDIYGDIDASYKDNFESFISNQKYAKYCGLVAFDKSVEVIKEYYALLFPSYWKGEGFPGTFIDALSAGVPIIASDWNFNKEIIHDGETGLIYPGKYADNLENCISFLIYNRADILELKLNCLHDAKFYNADMQIKRIIKAIEQG